MSATEKISFFVYDEKSTEWEQKKNSVLNNRKKNWLEKWTTLEVLELALATSPYYCEIMFVHARIFLECPLSAQNHNLQNKDARNYVCLYVFFLFELAAAVLNNKTN